MRNQYNALLDVPPFVTALSNEAQAAGVFTTGIVSNRKRTRGTAINVDVYGFDAAQELAVIQVRQCVFHHRRFPGVRKDYYLLGRLETGAVFAHPVDSPARSKRAMASPEACVQWVLAQIWDCPLDDLEDVRRQGDVAFVPATLPRTAQLLETQEITIRGSHVITAEEIWQDGDTYYTRRKAKALHTRGEHATVRANGCYRVQPGIRAGVWGFSVPTLD